MVQDDGGAGEGTRQVDRVGQLRMVLPGFETQTQRRQLGKALAEFRVEHLVRRHDARGILPDRFVPIPCHAVAKATQTPAGGSDFGLQQLAHTRADAEVTTANDTLGDATGTVTARGAHRGDAIDELDLAEGAISRGPSLRYMARHSRKTVETMLCPPPMSASNSGRR